MSYNQYVRHAAAGLSCSPPEPVWPVAAAAWAAAAASQAAMQLASVASGLGSERLRGSNETAAEAAAAARAAAAAAARVLLASPEDLRPNDGIAGANVSASAAAERAAIAASEAVKAATAAAAFASRSSANGSSSNVDPRGRNHCSPWTNKAPQDLAALSRAALPGGWAHGLRWLEKYGDAVIAACTREMGFDTVQMLSGASWRPELVIARPECTWPGQAQPPQECGARETALRTGWHAERSCVCTPGAAQACAPPPHGGRKGRAGKRTVINCGRAPLCRSHHSVSGANRGGGLIAVARRLRGV